MAYTQGELLAIQRLLGSNDKVAHMLGATAQEVADWLADRSKPAQEYVAKIEAASYCYKTLMKQKGFDAHNVRGWLTETVHPMDNGRTAMTAVEAIRENRLEEVRQLALNE